MRQGAFFMRSIKRVFFIVGLCVSEVFLLFSFSVPQVHATADDPGGTHVSGDLAADTVWDAQGSPYIFDGDVNIPTGLVLRIMPGVKVTMAPGLNPATLVVYGTLEVNGSPDGLVDITGIDRIYSGQGNIFISYATLHDSPTIVLYKSKAVVASSTISNANGSALYVWGSMVNAWNIRIENASANGILGLDALGAVPVISIHNSSIVDNPVAIKNWSRTLIHVENNWWGSEAGPATTGMNALRGPVSYTPWLEHDPIPPPVCCSSILFIPGIEGTRIYSGSNKLWEPDGNSDVTKLYLDLNGSSTDPAISPGEPIDKAYGLKGVYEKFLSFLNGLAQDGTIAEARAFGYDWRKPVDDIARGPLLGIAEEMASTSKTGKLSLVAHSNGGLAAKYLVKALSDAGKSGLIDAVISVAVPYLGTPEALAGLLHGDHQSILGGLILSQATARGLGENMPSAYGLLPSAAYFEHIFSPTIAFASTTVRGLNDGSYPGEIRLAQTQSDFILNVPEIRMQPSFTDVSRPLVGNRKLLEAAESLHALLDPLTWPSDIAAWAIAGWNADTTTGIKYHEKKGCDGMLARLWCRGSLIFHRLMTSIMGDGTVIMPSALYDSGKAVALDLDALSDEEGRDIAHANILEASTTREIVRKIVTEPRRAQPDISKLPGVSSGGQASFEPKPYLTVITHSMVELHVYDSLGRHTGLIAKPTLAEDNDFVAGAYETGIPGSRFEISDIESDPNTYIKLPFTGGEQYSVAVRGKDYGFFTFGIERPGGTEGDGNAESPDYYEMEPISPIMMATTSIDTDKIKTEGIIPALHVDIDGDGSADYEALPGGTGLPGNATTTEEAEKIARELSLEVLEKTDTEVMRDDPRREEFIKKLFPNSGDGLPAALPQAGASGQKTPPKAEGVDCEPG